MCGGGKVDLCLVEKLVVDPERAEVGGLRLVGQLDAVRSEVEEGGGMVAGLGD